MTFLAYYTTIEQLLKGHQVDIADLVPENEKDDFPNLSLQFQNEVYIVEHVS